MGGAAGPDLVAAVANAGGLGILPVWILEPERVTQEVRTTRRLTTRDFGVNVRADLVQLDHISAAIDEGETILRVGNAEIPRYSVVPPQQGMNGDVRAAVLYAGTGVERIGDCPAAAAVVTDLASLL